MLSEQIYSSQGLIMSIQHQLSKAQKRARRRKKVKNLKQQRYANMQREKEDQRNAKVDKRKMIYMRACLINHTNYDFKIMLNLLISGFIRTLQQIDPRFYISSDIQNLCTLYSPKSMKEFEVQNSFILRNVLHIQQIFDHKIPEKITQKIARIKDNFDQKITIYDINGYNGYFTNALIFNHILNIGLNHNLCEFNLKITSKSKVRLINSS